MIVFFFVLVPIAAYWVYTTYNSLIFEIFTPEELPEAKESSWTLAIVYWFFVISCFFNFLFLNFLMIWSLLILCHIGFKVWEDYKARDWQMT